MSSISVELVTSVDGSLDDNANFAAFQETYSKYKALVEADTVAIAAAVNAQFDKYPGASLNIDAIVHGALTVLNSNIHNQSSLTEKITSYIQNNTDRSMVVDRKTKEVVAVAEAPRTRLFGMKKGRNGGRFRWSDVPVVETDEQV